MSFNISVKNFIDEIKKEYNIDIINNIDYCDKDIILNSDSNFNFFKIFVLDLWKSGLCNIDKFVPIGTSEDNNIYIREKYYSYLSRYYAVYNETHNYIILKKY
jgi:hypothetical protein